MADLERTAQTAEASTVHKPFGKPGGPGLWHTGKQLPAYIQSVAHHLVTQGHDESRAIEMAVGIVKGWAAGHDGHGHHVHPDVQAAAVKAIAEWEKLRAQAHSDNRSGARRSAVSAGPEYDSDGLDGSWDGDHSDLPDLTGLGVDHFKAAEKHLGMTSPGGSGDSTSRAQLGTGARFKALKARLAAKGAHDPEALAAWIGRRKYGKGEFTSLAHAARKASGGGASRSELFRSYPLEDAHIVRTAEGDSSGRVVEAYCAVFEEPAEIHDHQGHYEEELDRAAFNKRIADVSRSRAGFGMVKVVYNHGMTIHGTPAERFSLPVAVPEHISAEGRGVLTRSRYLDTPLGNEVLEMWRSGAITSQSFTGQIIRSSPELRPGERYRPRNGRLTRVRRLELGLREYGPTPFPAYAGAELVGVRMSPLGTYEAAEDELEDEALSPDEEAAPGGPLDEHPTRYHMHRLWQMRTEEACRKAGIVLPGRAS